MNPIQIIATLRKFANYLAGLFPFLVTLFDRFVLKHLRKLANVSWIASILKRASKSPFLLGIWKFFERFYWRDYAKDRMEFGASPPEALQVLRPVIQLSVVMSLVIPFLQYQIAPVAIESFSGYKSTASTWAILLWIICLPCAWGALLAGTAVCNRVAFASAALGALYFLSTCVIQLPRSFFNGFLTMAIFLSLIYCERSLKKEGKLNLVFAWLNVLIVGIAAGCQFTILTPLRPWLGTIFTAPGIVLSIGFGSAIGIVAGIACLALARSTLPTKQNIVPILTGEVGMGNLLWGVVLSMLVYLSAGAARGGIGQIGGLILSSVDLSNAYLWPVLYFIGIGVIHKLLGSSKIIAASIKGMIHPKLMIPLMFCILLAATVGAMSEHISLFLSVQRGDAWLSALKAFLPIYSLSKTVIWHDPLLSISAHWMIWVFLFDILVTATLLLQKRLTGEAMSRLFFTTCLAALLIWEYVFQMASFNRGPIHSVIMIFLFAIWLLWLMHTVAWNLSLKSSPMWPSKGRFAIYGSMLTLIILQVNARTASHDYRIVNELFLTMFRGVIDVGLPYYLLIWANKRMKAASPPTGLLLGAFASGAVTSMLFNMFDKFAVSGWVMAPFCQIVKTQVDGLNNLGNINVELPIPAYWFFAKAIVFVCLLNFVRQFAIKRSQAKSVEVEAEAETKAEAKTEESPAHQLTLYLLLAFASGIVSFSYTLVDLPLPAEMRVALAPMHQELLFNCNILHTYLAFWIPALILAFASLTTNRPSSLVIFSLAAILTSGGILAGYQQFETLLRAIGLLYPVLMLFTAGLVALTLEILHAPQISRSETAHLPAPTTPAGDLLSHRSKITLVLASAAAYALISLLPTTSISWNPTPVPSLDSTVKLASTWQLQPTPPAAQATASQDTKKTSVYSRKTSNGLSFLQITSLESDPEGPRHQLQKLLEQCVMTNALPNLKLTSVNPWTRYHPGSIACQFAYEVPIGKTAMTMAGLSALVPLPNGRTYVFTLSTSPSEFEQAQWEVALMVESLLDPPPQLSPQPQAP